MEILLLTEDSSNEVVLQAILNKILYDIEYSYNENECSYRKVDSNHKQFTTANFWKNPDIGYDLDFVEFLQEIEDSIKNPKGFIVWHIDSDTLWKDRVAGKSIISYDQFSDRIINRLLYKDMSQQQIAESLFLTLPSYSIEAWLYPQISKLSAHSNFNLNLFLTKNHANHIDDIYKIKDQHTIKDSQNEFLAKKIDTQDLFNLKASFNSFYASLFSSEKFISLIPKY